MSDHADKTDLQLCAEQVDALVADNQRLREQIEDLEREIAFANRMGYTRSEARAALDGTP